MSRSIEQPSDAIARVYFQLEPDDIEFNDLIADIQVALIERYPSFCEEDKAYAPWRGNREMRVILENEHAQVTISEYIGLVAVCLVAESEEFPELAEQWAGSIEPGFRKVLDKYNLLTPMGTASNGEQFFRPVNRPGGLVTSKEGTLW